MFWDEVINKYYHVLTADERAKLYEWIGRNPSFNLKKEDCALFAARFNPKNQYKVTTVLKDKKEVHECFKWGEKYHTGKNTSLNEKYITDTNPIIYKK